MYFVQVHDVARPAVWQVCFCKNKREHFVDRFLAPGFRHVFLLGYVAEHRLWLWFDPLLTRTELAIVSHETAGRLLRRAVDEGAVLTMAPLPPPKLRLWHGFGSWCVPAVSRALGLRCVAATPKGLHDYLLTLGATVLSEDDDGQSIRRIESPQGRPVDQKGA